MAVASDFKTGLIDFVHNLGMGFGPGRGKEEGRLLYTLVLKQLDNGLGLDISPADVKGECDDLLFRLDTVYSGGFALGGEYRNILCLRIDNTRRKKTGRRCNNRFFYFFGMENIEHIHCRASLVSPTCP
ncbi:hypothetical protein D3C75_1102110 [compost metagenome]